VSPKPQVAFLVKDVPTSVAFYASLPGFTIADSPAQHTALILDPDDDPFLLVGPQRDDATPYLAEHGFILTPGESLNFLYPDLEGMQAALQRQGRTDVQIIEQRWGGRKLEAPDPDGFILTFLVDANHTPEEELSLYIGCVAELEQVLLDLSDNDLNLSLVPDSWPIRRIVHHLADTETLFCWWMKAALSESGRTFTQNWPAGNDPLSAISYATRPIEPSLDLIRAMHAHIAQLAQTLPDAWERYTVSDVEGKRTFGSLVSLVLRHMAEHIDEIEAIRRVHKK
jgi:catechol 2,3-dioxygenase-like lactoylglutathione lyase family enzyme